MYTSSNLFTLTLASFTQRAGGSGQVSSILDPFREKTGRAKRPWSLSRLKADLSWWEVSRAVRACMPCSLATLLVCLNLWLAKAEVFSLTKTPLAKRDCWNLFLCRMFLIAVVAASAISDGLLSSHKRHSLIWHWSFILSFWWCNEFMFSWYLEWWRSLEVGYRWYY